MKTSTEVAREILVIFEGDPDNEEALARVDAFISARDAEHEERCQLKVENAVARLSGEPIIDYSRAGVNPLVTRTGERLEPSAITVMESP